MNELDTTYRCVFNLHITIESTNLHTTTHTKSRHLSRDQVRLNRKWSWHLPFPNKKTVMRTKSATVITTENDRSLPKNRKERKKTFRPCSCSDYVTWVLGFSVPALGVITWLGVFSVPLPASRSSLISGAATLDDLFGNSGIQIHMQGTFLWALMAARVHNWDISSLCCRSLWFHEFLCFRHFTVPFEIRWSSVAS